MAPQTRPSRNPTVPPKVLRPPSDRPPARRKPSAGPFLSAAGVDTSSLHGAGGVGMSARNVSTGPVPVPARHSRLRLACMLAAGVAAGLPTAVFARPDYARRPDGRLPP